MKLERIPQKFQAKGKYKPTSMEYSENKKNENTNSQIFVDCGQSRMKDFVLKAFIILKKQK